MSEGKYSTAAQRWAGMGPYYAMFPSSFSDKVIDEYCPRGRTVLDPFAGRGTALFSAASSGRGAIGIELNPVGWIYSKTKLAPADKDLVEERFLDLQAFAPRYQKAAADLPKFFQHCFSEDVRMFLLSARHRLNWRQNKVDRTAMAFLLVHLHGKPSDAMSNQMRQTKAMSPKYAIRWWKEHGLRPPKLDPVEFLKKKLEWRYAKGIPKTRPSKVYLDDSVARLPEIVGTLTKSGLQRASLLLTSPPYFGITNYHYDQWLRLWLLGGPPTDRRSETPFNGRHRGKFANSASYRSLLEFVFMAAVPLLRPDAVVYVRTDKREPTLAITKKALSLAFPNHSLHRRTRPTKGETQTRLFGLDDPRLGEVDIILQPRGRTSRD